MKFKKVSYIDFCDGGRRNIHNNVFVKNHYWNLKLSRIYLSSAISALLKNKKKNIKKIDASHLKYKNALHNKR